MAAALEKRSTELGVSLPRSFAEWYAMQDGIALLRRQSNCDEPVAIERLGELVTWRWDEPRDLVRDGLVLFMMENQGVCVWALRLDAGDDPPVVVARDPDLEWRACTERFSAFIACQVWDYTEIFPPKDAPRILVGAQANPLEATDLAFLRSRLAEKATSHGWPSDAQYRFERDDSRLLVWNDEDQADWWISATTEAGLVTLLREVGECESLRQSWWNGHDERGESVLRTLDLGGARTMAESGDPGAPCDCHPSIGHARS
jgi:hypothetical protein